MRWTITEHAAQRFDERVRPVGLQAAKLELLRLIDVFGFEVPRPEWCHAGDETAREADFYVQVVEGIVVAARRDRSGPVAVTVLTKGGLDRARRNERYVARRDRRNARGHRMASAAGANHHERS